MPEIKASGPLVQEAELLPAAARYRQAGLTKNPPFTPVCRIVSTSRSFMCYLFIPTPFKLARRTGLTKRAKINAFGAIYTLTQPHIFYPARPGRGLLGFILTLL